MSNIFLSANVLLSDIAMGTTLVNNSSLLSKYFENEH